MSIHSEQNLRASLNHNLLIVLRKIVNVHSEQYLRTAIIEVLLKQGYRVDNGVINMPENPSKEDYRSLNSLAIQRKLEKASSTLKLQEERLIKYIANGYEVIPERISPRLVLVESNSDNALLFRYACLHWSIPVSSGYGRRLRFLVFDESNGKLIGLFGLGDPVYSLQARDKWIGWDKEMKAERLYHVMDAYVLGAVPPYSLLLGGKLIAMLVCSNEVREVFRKKYNGHVTLIRQKIHPPYLALVTTTSALGRSSIYNRIRANGQEYWTSLGFTQGSGEFHFSNGIYDDIRAYVQNNCEPTAKHEAWGNGYRNKREVIRKCLSKIGLSADLMYHGIQREIFAAQLGPNVIDFLKGDLQHPLFYNWPFKYLCETFADRWLMARSKSTPQYYDYKREQYKLCIKH